MLGSDFTRRVLRDLPDLQSPWRYRSHRGLRNEEAQASSTTDLNHRLRARIRRGLDMALTALCTGEGLFAFDPRHLGFVSIVQQLKGSPRLLVVRGNDD